MQESIDNNEIYDTNDMENQLYTYEQLRDIMKAYKSAIINNCQVIDHDYNIDINRDFNSIAWLRDYLQNKEDINQDLPW